MSFIESFATQVRDAYANQDEILFNSLITIDVASPNVAQLVQELAHTNENQAEQIVNAVLEDTSYALSECIVNYLQVVRYLYDEDIAFVFETFATFYSSIIPVFNGSDTFYQLPVVKVMSSNLVQLAMRVDKTGLKGKARKANTAARLLSKMFNTMLADRSPMDTSKRNGIFHVTNLAFKVYFKLNSMRMCQTFISNIRSAHMELKMFPISQQVTYNYYIGRYALYHGRLQEARKNLLDAFTRCHSSQWHNKRIILHYLIPTSIVLGRFPAVQLLEKYQLVEPYVNLMNTLRSGNIRGYFEHLETYFEYFYTKFTYLLLKERGVVLVWRCLVKNIYTQKQNIGSTQPVIEFGECLKAFKFATGNQTYTIQDMESLLVSLVSQSYVRGYLDHAKHRLVLSRVNAFPPVSHIKAHNDKYNEYVMEDHLENGLPPIPQDIQQYMNE